jgi:protein TonB
MFDENESLTKETGSKGRLAASLASSLVIYGGVAMAIVAATAAVKQVVAKEELVQIEFTPPAAEVAPPPPAPKPKLKKVSAPRGPRPKAARESLETPKEIPAEVPTESEGDLVDADGTGPVDGYIDGTEGGEGNDAPAPSDGTDGEARGSEGPRVVSRPPPPEYPTEAREARIEGLVLVRCVVSLSGKNEDCRALRGDALLRDVAVRYVATFRMAPARDAAGEPERMPQVFPVRFESRNL